VTGPSLYRNVGMPAKFLAVRCVEKRNEYVTSLLASPSLSILISYLTSGSNGKKFGPPAGYSSGT
jgi:hypothetical protein